MTIYQLAFQYLNRKKAKTFLLFFVIFFIGSMILGTNMMLRATQESKIAMQEKMNAKVVLEITNEQNKINMNDIQKIQQFDEVISMNRMAHGTTFPLNFKPITNSESTEDRNSKITLLSYDDLKNDSGFFEDIYKLTDGSFIDNDSNHGVVINSLLAQHNHLNIGDELLFETMDKQSVSTTIIGLYSSGSETKQDDTQIAVNRIENQIFIDNAAYFEILGKEEYYKVAVYSKLPDQLYDLESNLKTMFPDKVEISTSNALYEQMEAPLNQVLKISNVMLMLTLITGTTIVSLLLCMWMRTRKKEMAVFISMGKSKSSIILQVLFESMVVFGGAMAATSISGCAMAPLLQYLLISYTTMNMELQISMQLQDIQVLVGLGAMIVSFAVLCSILPILNTNPKDTLSRMEG